MEQEQHREQLAASGAGSGESPSVLYQATASRRGDVSPWAPAALAGVALLGVIVLLRRPREAFAPLPAPRPQRAAQPTRMAERRRKGML
jgi:hypothetical protein